ncbi:MAG: hypothetical protein ABEK50_07885 [bacterium]
MSSENRSSYPLMEVISWLAPILGLVLLIASTLSGAWSAQSFAGAIGTIPGGILGVIVGAVLGLITGVAIAFPYFLLGELSRALIDLVTSAERSAQNTQKLVESFEKSEE